MKILYENVDISKDVELNGCIYKDFAGGNADSLSISFSNSKGIWNGWKPEKGHRIEIASDTCTTGSMYIDNFGQKGEKIIFGASSLSPKTKTKKNRTWINIKFKQIAMDIATSLGFVLDMFDITDYLYTSVSQINETELEFLNRLCIREGYILKISNNHLIIYDEIIFENKTSIKTFSYGECVHEFKSVSDEIFSACTIKYLDCNGSLLKYTFYPQKSILGPVLKIDEQVYGIGEAERFSKKYLRQYNKYERIGKLFVRIDNTYSAGNVISISMDNLFDGKYFIYETEDDFISNKRILKIRSVLEGY